MGTDLCTPVDLQRRIDKMPKVVRDEVARLNRIIDELRAELATSFPGTEVQLDLAYPTPPRDLPPGSMVVFTLQRRAGQSGGSPAPRIEVRRDAAEPTRLYVTTSHGQLVVLPRVTNALGLAVYDFGDE